MKPLVLALPILRGKEEEWRRFAQELEEAYPREYEDLRRRLGVRAERVWLVQASCGEVALAYAEVEAPEEAIRRLAASEEPFDAWFREKLLELHGYDLIGSGPRPEPELVFAYAPRGVMKEPPVIPDHLKPSKGGKHELRGGAHGGVPM